MNQTQSTDNGKLALCLVDDLLENLELRYSGTVFRSESGFKSDRSAVEMRNTLGLEMDYKVPVLVQLLDKINPTPLPNRTVTLDESKSSDESHISNTRNSL